MSKIEPLPGCAWSPSAALADAYEDSDDMDAVFIMSIMKDGTKEVRTSNLDNKQTAWILLNHLYRMLRENNDLVMKE